MAQLIEIFGRVHNGFRLRALKVSAVIKNGVITHQVIGAFKDVKLRKSDKSHPGDDCTQFSREIESDSGKPFKEIVHTEQCGAFKVKTPGAPPGKEFFHISVPVSSGNEKIGTCGFDHKTVSGEFFPVNAGTFAPLVETENNGVPGSGKLVFHGEFRSQHLTENILELLCGKPGNV
jgi:hypothetical protein